MFFNRKISFELAKELKRKGFTQYLSLEDYDEKGSITDNRSIETYNAPTYAEVFDYLIPKGIFIELIPGLTFALEEKMGFTYVIHTVDKEEPKLNRKEWDDFASFRLCAEMAILQAVDIMNTQADK